MTRVNVGKASWHYHDHETPVQRQARRAREAEAEDGKWLPQWEDARFVTHEDLGDWAGDHKRDLGRRR